MKYVKQYDPVTNNGGSFVKLGPILDNSTGKPIVADSFGTNPGAINSWFVNGIVEIVKPDGNLVDRTSLYNNNMLVLSADGGESTGYILLSAGTGVYSEIGGALSATGMVQVTISGAYTDADGSGSVQTYTDDIVVLSPSKYAEMFNTKTNIELDNLLFIKTHSRNQRLDGVIVGPFVDVNGTPVTSLTASDVRGSSITTDYTWLETLQPVEIRDDSSRGNLDLTEIDSTNLPGYYYLSLDCYSAYLGISIFSKKGNGVLRFADSVADKFVPFKQKIYVQDVNENFGKLQSITTNGKTEIACYFVDSSVGSDSTKDGLTWEAPFATVGKAISIVNGDSFDASMIFVKSGTYNENIVIPQNCTVRGVQNENGQVIISGDSSTNAPTIILLENSKIENITFGRYGATGTLTNIAVMSNGSEIKNCISDRLPDMGGSNINQARIIHVTGSNCIIDGNILDGNDVQSAYSVAISGDACTVKNNIITGRRSGSTASYVYIYAGITNPTVKDNNFLGVQTAQSCVLVGTPTTIYDATIVNNKYSMGYGINKGTNSFFNQTLLDAMTQPKLIADNHMSTNEEVWNNSDDNYRTLTSGVDSTSLLSILASTSGLNGEAMRGTDNVGSISADIITSGGTVLHVAGATIKDIEVRSNIVYLTYRDPADGKMKTYSQPFTQDIIIASGGDLA